MSKRRLAKSRTLKRVKAFLRGDLKMTGVEWGALLACAGTLLAGVLAMVVVYCVTVSHK
jgi:hypothetical protein